ncbi:MAG: glucokinase [Gammaproteobacteria bacterium]|nr:glucokinase [Gammaproteobacteria bacterium]MDH5630373.1 glucokinase [Gammaproteobacteria bacterium]
MQQTKKANTYLVADIGGTNARFGLVTGFDTEKQQYIIEQQKVYASQDYGNFEDVVARYLNSLSQTSISNACIAVAGPVVGNKIKLTNLDWRIDISSVKQKLGFNKFQIINDFAAYAYSVQYLKPENLCVINPGVSLANSPVVVLGPGTGFGVATLIQQGNKRVVFPSEGGHVTLASNTSLQSAIKEKLSHKFKLVSVERVFSGSGLRHLYQALAEVEGVKAYKYSTAEISQNALDGNDLLCERALSLFCSWLGSVVGDIVLTLGAKGGVYLGGGILPRIKDFLVQSDFALSFRSKDQMSHYLEDVPVNLVIKENPALQGAAALFEHNLQHMDSI